MYDLPEISGEYQIYEDSLEIAGLVRRKVEVAHFARGKQKSLEWVRDPSNAYDKYAIQIFGVYKGFFRWKHILLGYVPRQVAKTIIERGLWGDVQPRLIRAYVNSGGFVEILFQIFGPKERLEEYKDVAGKQMGSTPESLEVVKTLKREKRNDEAITLLQELVENAEAEADSTGGVAPWCYEQLAIIYRKKRHYDNEVAILERYARQPKAPGVGPQKLAERLDKARQLQARKKA